MVLSPSSNKHFQTGYGTGPVLRGAQQTQRELISARKTSHKAVFMFQWHSICCYLFVQRPPKEEEEEEEEEEPVSPPVVIRKAKTDKSKRKKKEGKVILVLCCF